MKYGLNLQTNKKTIPDGNLLNPSKNSLSHINTFSIAEFSFFFTNTHSQTQTNFLHIKTIYNYIHKQIISFLSSSHTL
jgi:hypothetical protein